MLDRWLPDALREASVAPMLPIAPVLPKKLHTFYGGAHLFRETTLARMAKVGQQGFDTFFPTPEALGAWYAQVFKLRTSATDVAENSILGEGCVQSEMPAFSNDELSKIHGQLQACITRKYIEDYRIDFEDGYGIHEHAEEITEAKRCAKVLVQIVAAAKDKDDLPEFGIRLKPFSGAHRDHSVRLLGHFFDALQQEIDLNQLPRFWVTLPKIRDAAEGASLLRMLQSLEAELGLAPDTFGLEMLFETLESIQALGQPEQLLAWVPQVQAGICRRPSALVLGTFDTCAEWGIAALNQGHQHPLMDQVRLQALTWGNQVGAYVVDSITRAVPQLSGPIDPLVVHGRHVLHSLAMGVSAGWDIHPLQVLARHAVRLAVISAGLPQAISRLKQFLTAQTHASRVGAAFDDLATVRGLMAQLTQAEALGLVTPEALTSEGIAWPLVLPS